MRENKLKSIKNSKFFRSCLSADRFDFLDFILSRKANGFTLMELLLVVGILAVLTAISAPMYINFVKSSELDSVSKTTLSFLKEARSKSMSGNLGLKWGVHFVNGAADYYESFSTPTDYSDGSKKVVSTVYLSLGVNFNEPITTSDVIFGKITGTTTATTTIIFVSSNNESKTVTVTPIGNIY